jgi:LytS/YehU family sensor histidine kinase
LKNKQLEAELIRARLEALKVRMNPHLIANALTSIRGLVSKNENDAAYEYLTLIAALIRTTFKNAEKDFISLSSEVSYLMNYVEIEKLRFGNKLRFHLVIPENLNASNIMVPQMLIQPFIENAINHGIKHLLKDGVIKLEFISDGTFLTCMIEDNGVGRKKAQEIEAHSITSHTSESDKITRERILLLNQLFHSSAFTIKIIDLENENGQGSGTQVIIQMPAMDIGGWNDILQNKPHRK